MIIKSTMNKDNWLLTFSLFYVMQPPSIYFGILKIIGYCQMQSPIWNEHQK
jgi:hypothetical protein